MRQKHFSFNRRNLGMHNNSTKHFQKAHTHVPRQQEEKYDNSINATENNDAMLDKYAEVKSLEDVSNYINQHGKLEYPPTGLVDGASYTIKVNRKIKTELIILKERSGYRFSAEMMLEAIIYYLENNPHLKTFP